MKYAVKNIFFCLSLFSAAALCPAQSRLTFHERFGTIPQVAQLTRIIDWKPYFTLSPTEGTSFVVDTVAIVPGGGVPVINITNTGQVILTSAGGQLQAFEVSNDGGTYTPTTRPSRGPDGGFIYLPDGRTRFLTEEPDPTRTPQRHKSRVVSWISSDGMDWIKEAGVRYQPGLEDDSISSVVSVIQVGDSIWRMYFVGDWYRSNGTRTAISSDWGVTWQQESLNNILRRGDVDPHPVYLTNGKIRLYFRAGMNSQESSERGIGYCDSNDGLGFDTLQIKVLVADTALPPMLKLDPSVIRFPNGSVACYIGATPGPGSPTQENPKLIAAWDFKNTITHSYSISNRWNLLSVPLLVNDYRTQILFPSASSSAFAYNGSYDAQDTLENGRGYWLKFDTTQTIQITGTEITIDTMEVITGWNLIGSISIPILTSSILSVPSELATSNFFGYDAGYRTVDTLKPGRGYWVKVDQDGQLILSSWANTSPANRIKMVPTDEIPPSHRQ